MEIKKSVSERSFISGLGLGLRLVVSDLGGVIVNASNRISNADLSLKAHPPYIRSLNIL